MSGRVIHRACGQRPWSGPRFRATVTASQGNGVRTGHGSQHRPTSCRSPSLPSPPGHRQGARHEHRGAVGKSRQHLCGAVGGQLRAVRRRGVRRAGSDRMPPQDHAAEQSVIGSMLLSKDAIADVVENIRGTDFYRPAHETIFDAIIDLYGRGEPVDPVTTSAELSRRGELVKVGGAPYLHTLSASVPIAANASYYAEIVREKAILRRLVSAGTKIVQMGYAGEGDGRRHRRRRAAGGLPGHRQADLRGLRAAERDHGGHARRDRGDLEPRRRDDRGPDRLRRPRRADQRHARRSDDHHRRASRGREGAGARHRAAHPDGLDHDGRGRRRRRAARRRGQPDAGGGRDAADAAPSLLPPDVLRRLGDRGRLAAPVGHPRGGRIPVGDRLGRLHDHHGRAGAHHRGLPHHRDAGRCVGQGRERRAGRDRAGALRPGRQRRPPLPGRTDRASPPTTRRWPWTSAGPRASTTTRPRSSSASR